MVIRLSLHPGLAPELLCQCLAVPCISLCWGCLLSVQLQLQYPALQPQDLQGNQVPGHLGPVIIYLSILRNTQYTQHRWGLTDTECAQSHGAHLDPSQCWSQVCTLPPMP